MTFGTLLIVAYLCGSVPFGKLVGRAYGVDIQRLGSGNIGFANVQRVLGWRAGYLTLAGDVLKGGVPTFAALSLLGSGAAFWVGLAAIAGHVYPIWLRFRGGKGIATGLGLVAVLQPLAAVGGVVCYIAGRFWLKSSAFGSLMGIACVMVIGCLVQPADWWRYTVLLTIALWTLRHNIMRRVPSYDL